MKLSTIETIIQQNVRTTPDNAKLDDLEADGKNLGPGQQDSGTLIQYILLRMGSCKSQWFGKITADLRFSTHECFNMNAVQVALIKSNT